MTEWVTVGQVSGAHGVRGAVRIYSYTQPHNNLLDYQPLHFCQNDKMEEVRFSKSRTQGKELIVHIEGCETRDQAAALKGTQILIERSQLPTLESHDFYWSELIGLNVVTVQGANLGTVSSILETGANDVLVVKGEQQEVLIPYLPNSVVIKIELSTKTITVDWDANF